MSKLVTVKDFKDAGLGLADGDKGKSFTVKAAKHFNSSGTFDDCAVEEFAWRTNTGVNPKFNGEIEVKDFDGNSVVLFTSDINWAEDIVWRPIITKKDPKESKQPLRLGDEEDMEECLSDIAKLFGMVYGIDCGWSNLAENIEAKLTPATINQSKPVYTQAMADTGELPPVGCECLCTFDSEDWDGKVVKVYSHDVRSNDNVVLAGREISSGGVTAVEFHRKYLKPLDTRTDEEKLRDALVEQLASKGDMHNEFGKARDAVSWLMESNKFTITLNE